MNSSTELSGKNSLNSLYNCVAKTLLCATTSVGLFNCSITLAIVKVLPEPVTPSSVSHWLPSLKPATNSAMACGWSPVGLYSECSLKTCSLLILLFPFEDVSATAIFYHVHTKKYRTNIRFVLCL